MTKYKENYYIPRIYLSYFFIFNENNENQFWKIDNKEIIIIIKFKSFQIWGRFFKYNLLLFINYLDDFCV